MTDSLSTSSSPPNFNNDNVGIKREASEDFDENNIAKIRRPSTERQDDNLTSTTMKPVLDVISTTPVKVENNNNTATTSTANDDDKNNINNAHADINATTSDDTLLHDQNNGAATTAAATLSSLLTNQQQQQQFLQIYAQASGLDLTQLTASSLAQAMISPISVPGFNLLQQLQSGGVITALPGPPAEFGLGGNNNRWTLQHSPVKDTNDATKNDNRSTSDGTNDTNDTKNDTTTTPIDTAGPSPSSSLAFPDMTSVAAGTARTISNDERRQRRLLRNRVAAKECRKKKKQYIQDMELKIRRLEEQNTALRVQIDDITNKLSLPTIQGPESYRLMKEVEELNAKLGIGHLAPSSSGTATVTKDESIPTIVDSSSASSSASSSSSSSSTNLSTLASTQQYPETCSSNSTSASTSLYSTSASASASALTSTSSTSTSTPFSVSTPVPTAIPPTMETTSITSSVTNTINQSIKSLPSASTTVQPPPPPSPKVSARKSESSLSSTNNLHATGTTTLKMESMDQR